MTSKIDNLKGITVLYCEDEDDLREITNDVLVQFTKKVHLAQNGQIGLEIFKKYSNQIDLIITDVNMPELNGLLMSKEIKEINPNIPIIVTTAFSNSSYLLEAIELGIDKYVLKPIDIKKLLSVMTKSLLYHELRDLYRDAMTHLNNRNALIKDIKNNPESLMALVDIDDFSIINELYGEDHGDTLLINFSTKLEQYFPKNRYKIYRVGADIFLIASYDTATTSENILKEELEAFTKSIDMNGIQVHNNSINFGLTISIAKSENSHTFEYAQRVLHIAKEKLVPILIYDANIHTKVDDFEENLQWIKKLKTGLTDGSFRAYYQAIVDSSTQEVYKYEALIRYIDEEGNPVAPYKFLPIAKKAKLYSGIIKLMMRECIAFIRGKNKTVAVNISFDDIKNSDTRDYILNMIEENKDITKSLHFELLETEEIEDFTIVKEFIDTVHSYGCLVGVDDFGAGYSNFNMLEALKVDFVKIDGSLIKKVDTDKTQEIIVDTIAGYAKRTEVKTVAEFVSSEGIYEKIHELGIDYAQGYYFNKPISYEEVN